MGYENRFIGGDVTLINEPVFNEPFAGFWLTPSSTRTRWPSGIGSGWSPTRPGTFRTPGTRR